MNTQIDFISSTKETEPAIEDQNMLTKSSVTVNQNVTSVLPAIHENSEVLENNSPFEIAQEWLHQEKTVNSKLIFRVYQGIFLEYDGMCYREVSHKSVCNQIKEFLTGKSYKYNYYGTAANPIEEIKPFNPTKTMINKAVRVLSLYCKIGDNIEQPSWLTNKPGRADAEHLISFRNGLLDFDQYYKGKIVMYKHSPDLFITSSLPYDFNPDAYSPTWNYILESGLFDLSNGHNDKVNLLSQWMGYNLMPGLQNKYETLLILAGKSEPAKTLIVDMMQAMFGYSNCLTTSFQAVAGHNGFRILLGKLSIIVKDTNTPTKRIPNKALDKIMQVVRNNPININQNIPNLIKLPCKFTIVTNNIPIFNANKRDVLDYHTRILSLNESCDKDEYIRLRQSLIEDAESGKLINFALNGLASLLQSRGNFIGLYKTELSPSITGPRSIPLVRFMVDYVVPDLGCRVTTDDLYAEWIRVCKDEDINAGTKSVFIKNLLQTLPDLKIRRLLINGKQTKVIQGVRFLNYRKAEQTVSV